MAAEMRVERQTQIDAAPEAVYALIADFRRWQQWSPWEDVDPEMEREYQGDAGTGMTYAWHGNKKAGEGSMTITDAQPGKLVAIDLQFLKPFKSQSTATFTLTEQGGGTHVDWSMRAKQNRALRMVSGALKLDKKIGDDFERGLARLKAQAEAASAAGA